MDRRAYAVIGAGYGDEGKGLLTDYLSRKLGSGYIKPLVARQNGGAQAGHTVVHGDQRHVFRHLGAGTLNGSITYLGSAFLVNPVALRDEVVELKSLGINPMVVCHPDAQITTVFDMLINQMLEESRGNHRHGSCGMGINETLRRVDAGFPLTVKMAGNLMEFGQMLWRIRQEWAAQRLEQLGIDTEENKLKIASINIHLLATDYYGIIKHHLKDGVVQNMPATRCPLVIEGAQGLAIDEFLGAFPHVTPSITGLPSAIKVAKECGRNSLHPIYVTRAYATRHGAGPFPYEGEIKPTSVEGETNVFNQWQGDLRYGLLDVSGLANRIRADLDRSVEFAKWNHVEVEDPRILITCMDQIGEYGSFYFEGRKCREPKETFFEAIISHLRIVVPEMRIFGESFGPSADHIVSAVL